jgi:tight adherence protein B
MKLKSFGAALAVALAIPAAANASEPVQIRHVNLTKFPRVQLTAVAAPGTRPALLENGQRAGYVTMRELGTAEAMVLAVDNSESMQGGPLREAKRAAGSCLAEQPGMRSSGLVVFGHEALALTRPGEATAEVASAIASLRPDTQPGTSLYDAVKVSVTRLQRMSNGIRILVLLTDGRDVGSRASLAEAIAAAERANVVVYAIAAGSRAATQPLATLARATGGQLFNADDAARLSRTYDAVRRDLERTWLISYLARARPGDRVELTLTAGSARSTTVVQIPPQGDGHALVPSSIAGSPLAALAVVLLAAALVATAGAAAARQRGKSTIARLLEPHVSVAEGKQEEQQRSSRLESLVDWAERSLADLPGAERLERAVERSGVRVRLGHIPFLSGLGAFFLAVVGTILGAGPRLGILLMLVGLGLPIVALKIAARRRTKAFDRQLPDVLAGLASTLRAGHGLRTALRAVADDGSPPASEEFKRVLGEERLGRPLDEAIAAMCARVGSPDMDYVATAINVQSQTGGSMATLFDTLSETVRERQRHARRVRALTSMGRMSATVLICLPFGLATLMTLISPSYMAPLFQTSGGHILIGVCVSSMTLGALALKRIVNVRY